LNKKEIQIIDSIIEAISSIIKGEMPQKIDLKGHDNRKIKELVSTTNRLFESFSEANDFIASLAQGKLDIEVPVRNNLASQFKQLHSNLRHLTWQVQQVAEGDYSQSVDFLGDFSDNFNSMITALKEKKQVEEALRASEEKYSSLFHKSNDGIFIHDLEGNIIDVNQKVLDQFGYTKSEIVSFKIPYLHPPEALEKSEWAFETISREGFVSLEIDFKKKTGEVFPAEISSSLFEIGDKKVIQGIVRDITERKQVEEEIRSLSQMLMNVQERERKMISYELHDRIAQNLSTLKIGCDMLFDGQSKISSELIAKTAYLSKIIREIISTVRDLSYDLQPPVLDQFGLVYTLKKYCEEFSQNTSIKVDFQSMGIAKLNMDADTEIHLYRLVQEGLNNIRKHADSDKAIVRLLGVFPNIILRIEDTGKGFDVKARKLALGDEKRMGIRSMKERVNLLGGQMIIQSRLMQGTRIAIKIPNNEKTDFPKET
jgi:PAS domain S-box-containing protein